MKPPIIADTLLDPQDPPDDFVDPPEPPQCPSTCYDRAVSADTRCRQPEGHEGRHDDGAMTWEDEEPCDAVDALQARIAAILKDRTTDSGVLNFALILDMAERAQDFEDDFSKVKAEKCAGDEVHCSCVIHLRRHIEELKAEIATLKQPFSLHIDTAGSRLWKRGEQCQHERTYTAEATICRRCSVAVEPSQPTSDIYCNNCLLPADKCRHKTRALSRYTAEEIERMRRERGPSVHAEDPFEDYVRSLDGVAPDMLFFQAESRRGSGMVRSPSPRKQPPT